MEKVKPIIAGDHDTYCGLWWYVCPKCYFSVDYKDEECAHCETPLDWEDDDED